MIKLFLIDTDKKEDIEQLLDYLKESRGEIMNFMTDDSTSRIAINIEYEEDF